VPVTEENLRFGYVYDGDGAELEFRPFADGIVNVELKDNNDWATMGRSGGICSGLVLAQPGGPVSQCPSAP